MTSMFSATSCKHHLQVGWSAARQILKKLIFDIVFDAAQTCYVWQEKHKRKGWSAPCPN